MASNTIVETFSLTKIYNKHAIGIENVNSKIPGGSVGLLGPNGAGKTTLIRTLLGIIRPTNGTATVLDYDIKKDINKVRDRIGYMPEYIHSYIPDSSAMKMVSFVGKMGGLSTSDAKQRASDTLFYVGLGEERYRELKTFSLGMKAKLKLAIALVHDPEILILDEPTNGLDPNGRVKMLDLISSLHKEEGKNIILSSHLLKDVERSTNYIVLMGNGKLMGQGDLDSFTGRKSQYINVKVKKNPLELVQILNDNGLPAKLLKSHQHAKIQVERSEGIELKIFKLAHKHGFGIRSLGSTATNLEDVFVSMFNGGNNND